MGGGGVASGMKRLVIIIVAMVLGFSVLFVVADQFGWLEHDFVEQHLSAIQGSGAGQALVVTAIIGLLAVDLVLPVPSSIIMALSGKLLGFLPGGLVAFAGAMLAAAIGFYGCRLGGQRVFDRLVGAADAENISAWFRRYGVYAIILSRPVPMLTEILSCLAGLSKVRARIFFAASILGTLPICFVYSYFGHLGDLTNPWPAIGIALVVPAIGWFIVRRLKRATKSGSKHGPGCKRGSERGE